ncbi:hypothetical protein T484DRAFT_3150007, partial [Baffinella frigidus]
KSASERVREASRVVSWANNLFSPPHNLYSAFKERGKGGGEKRVRRTVCGRMEAKGGGDRTRQRPGPGRGGFGRGRGGQGGWEGRGFGGGAGGAAGGQGEREDGGGRGGAGGVSQVAAWLEVMGRWGDGGALAERDEEALRSLARLRPQQIRGDVAKRAADVVLAGARRVASSVDATAAALRGGTGPSAGGAAQEIVLWLRAAQRLLYQEAVSPTEEQRAGALLAFIAAEVALQRPGAPGASDGGTLLHTLEAELVRAIGCLTYEGGAAVAPHLDALLSSLAPALPVPPPPPPGGTSPPLHGGEASLGALLLAGHAADAAANACAAMAGKLEAPHVASLVRLFGGNALAAAALLAAAGQRRAGLPHLSLDDGAAQVA